MNNNDAEKYFNVAEVAKQLGVSKGLIYKLINLGQIKHLRLGDRIIIKNYDLDEYLEKRRVDTKKN